MSERIIMRTGEALIAGGPAGTAAEPEVIIGELDGPVGTAIATMTAGQVSGHTRLFAILNRVHLNKRHQSPIGFILTP